MKLKIVFFIIISILFSSCTSQKNENLFFEKYPSWYLNPISSDATHLYGIGEGDNLDEATKNALVSISSNLSLSINATSTLKKESSFKYREYVSKEYLENIDSSTQKLTFQEYEVVNFYKQNYKKFLAQVRVKKSNLVKSLKNEFELLDTEYLDVLQELKNKDFLTKYLEYEKLNEKVKAYINKNQILENLDSTYNGTVFISKLKKLNQKIKSSKSKVSFHILKENQYPKISSWLKQYLTNNGFEIKDTSSYKIDIQSKIDSKNARGIFIVNNTITISILYSNKVLKSYVYETQGVSSNSEDDAINISYNLEDIEAKLFL